MGRPGHPLSANPPAPQHGDLIADVARSRGYAQHTHDLAQRTGADQRVIAELAEIVERLGALHLVVLVADGCCGTCGAQLSDPRRSPSGARHCPACRVGWALIQGRRGLRAASRPWPASG